MFLLYMSKPDIDYSNTIFYKIYCKDADIKELYVGHTTNFVQRKYNHKQTCTNEKNANHNLKVYKCIRDNGGWDNWKMEIIGFRDCYDHYEARKIEQNYFDTMCATLNSVEPLRKSKLGPMKLSEPKKEKRTWYCNVFETICETDKHKRNQKNVQMIAKNSQKFLCESCDYKTVRKSQYERHLMTLKHKILTSAYEIVPKSSKYSCKCGKEYKHRQSLYTHKQKCSSIKNTIVVIDNDDVKCENL